MFPLRHCFRILLLTAATTGPWCQSNTGQKSDSGGVILELPQATVKSKKEAPQEIEVKSDFIRKIPNTMNDPLRAISFMPGVTVQSDLNIRPFIRGGDADQTEVVMNGLTLLQPYHVGGVFSVFNLNALESVHLYREDFPVEYPGALSGVVRLTPKKPSLIGLHAKTNLSLLRGDIYSEIPILKNKASIYGAAQSFLFNKSMHGLLDVASLFSKDEVFQEDIQKYRDHINLPDFQDYHWGAAYLLTENLQLDYAGNFSTDAYTVVIPAQTNILNRPSKPVENPIPVPPIIPKKEINRTKKLSVDSISSVSIHNQTHFLNFQWDANPKLTLENNLGYQSQNWDVNFKKASEYTPPLALNQSSLFLNYRLMGTFNLSDAQQFKMGMSYDYKYQDFVTEIPYVLYDVIVNSNLDMLDALGNFTDAGFQVEKTDTSHSNFDYLGDYPARIRFSNHGYLEERFVGLFYSHTLKTRSGSLSYGFRGDYQNTSNEFFLTPRLSYTWQVNPENELFLSSGLYSQNNFPYFERDQNRGLLSEKSAQIGLQWTHQIGAGYRIILQNYYKRYFDLVTSNLTPNGTLDLDGLQLPDPNSKLSTQEIMELQSILDTATRFSDLPDSIQQLAYPTFGNLVYNYSNQGTGNSYGTEISFFYNPNSIWNGWFSLDFSTSNRQDGEGRPSYEYRYHRPLVFNWVNYFDIPGNYEFSLTYRWAMGQAYTPYSGSLDGKGQLDPIVVGARNSGRLAPYSRLDLRLSRNFKLWGLPFKGYAEVWNSMNEPNYFARDYYTGELKSAQLNWPFPLLFLGFSGEL